MLKQLYEVIKVSSAHFQRMQEARVEHRKKRHKNLSAYEATQCYAPYSQNGHTLTFNVNIADITAMQWLEVVHLTHKLNENMSFASPH